MGQPCPVLPPPDVPHPAAFHPPSLSLHRIWRLPNLSLCNYLSGTTCETPVTPPPPRRQENKLHTCAEIPTHSLALHPQRAQLREGELCWASPGLLLPSLWSPTLLSSRLFPVVTHHPLLWALPCGHPPPLLRALPCGHPSSFSSGP